MEFNHDMGCLIFLGIREWLMQRVFDPARKSRRKKCLPGANNFEIFFLISIFQQYKKPVWVPTTDRWDQKNAIPHDDTGFYEEKEMKESLDLKGSTYKIQVNAWNIHEKDETP